MSKIRASVVGASGYGGAEAVRLLVGHPNVELMHVTAESQQGRAMSDLYPNLRHFVDREMVAADPQRIGSDSDLVIVSLPSGKAMGLVPELLAQGCKVIDVAADFRLRDAALYPTWYKFDHQAPSLLAEAVYGLPELHGTAISNTRLLANPGCYPVASLLAAAPLVQAGVAAPTGIVIDAKSGISGAGRGGGGAIGYSEVNENTRAYGVAGHNHTAEIEQELSGLAGEAVKVVFTPHLVPMTRGILATVYLPLARDLSPAEALDIYDDAYGQAPFVRVLREHLPETKATLGSNFCDVTVRLDKRTGTAIAVAAIDNLGRGAAGQAIQNLNLMCGLPECTGLMHPALYP